MASKYSDVDFDELFYQMMIDNILEDETNILILEALAKDYANKGSGLTKAMMYQTIKVKHLKKQGGQYKETIEPIKRRAVDIAIAFLLGTTLICQETQKKFIRYTLTKHGVKACIYLRNKFQKEE